MHEDVGGFIEVEQLGSQIGRRHGFFVGCHEFGEGILGDDFYGEVGVHTSNCTTTCVVFLQESVDCIGCSITWYWMRIGITAWFALHFDLEINNITVFKLISIFTGNVSLISSRSTCCSCVHQLCSSALVAEPEPLVSVIHSLVVGSRNIRGTS